jgi:aspartate/methionine/tyrosine aminotransferase
MELAATSSPSPNSPAVCYAYIMFARRTEWQLSPNKFSIALEHQRREGAKLLDLSASNPTRCDFVYDRHAIMRALVHRASLDYEPDPRGLRSARQAICDYYAERGDRIDCAQLVLTTSTSEAYSFILRLLCDPGDEVLIPQPSYPLFEYLAGICDVVLRPYELVYDHGWQIDFESLNQVVSPRTRAVMVVHPNNPTGSYVKEHERDQLNQFCAARDAAIVADEVFLDYVLDGPARSSFATNSAAPTFTLSGLSKICGLPQMKLAWMVIGGPERLAHDASSRMEVIADTYLSMNAPIQHATRELLAQREITQRQLMSRVRRNLAELDGQLAASDVRRLEIEGGWYAVLRVPVTRSDEEMAVEFLERDHVIVHPGHFFDFHQDGHMVLSLITPEDDFAEGVRRVLSRVKAAASAA